MLPRLPADNGLHAEIETICRSGLRRRLPADIEKLPRLLGLPILPRLPAESGRLHDGVEKTAEMVRI